MKMGGNYADYKNKDKIKKQVKVLVSCKLSIKK